MFKQKIEHCSDGDGPGVGAGEKGYHYLAHDGVVVDEVGIFRLALDKLLQKVRNSRIEVFVFLLHPCNQKFQG